MSIHSVVLHFMLASNELQKITGKFLSIGRQTVFVDSVRAASILDAYGFRAPEMEGSKDGRIIDSITRNNTGGIRDDVLVSIFSEADYRCLDKSDYEGAHDTVDLNAASIPPIHRGKYDFIYDGGTLDNVFSPAHAIRNLAEMLAVGGRILHFDVAGAWPGAYCSFSCEWFFSFYAANNFEDVRVFLAVPLEGDDGWPDPRFRLFSYSPFFNRRAGYDPLLATREAIPVGAFVLCTARKGPYATFDKIPTQSHYLDAGEADWRDKYSEYSTSTPFPLRFDEKNASVAENQSTGETMPLCSDHYAPAGIL